MDLGPITIAATEAGNVNPNLFRHLAERFQPLLDAEVTTLTADEFLDELLKAYAGYLQEERARMVAEGAEEAEEADLEKLFAQLAPITAEAIGCVIENKAKAPLLLRKLHETAEKNFLSFQGAAQRNPGRALFDENLKNQLLLWAIVTIKTGDE